MTDPADKPDPGAWLPMVHFGFVGNPLPPLAADTEEDPDDELLAVTPPEVIMMLGFDPLDDDEDGDDQPGETVPST